MSIPNPQFLIPNSLGMLLLSGSLAYDSIMDFPDTFKNHILPDNIHILNVCFVVDKLDRHFGGTGGNIAYTMKLLGGNPTLVAPLGKDGRDYLEHLHKHGLDTNHITTHDSRMTASAYITTDKDNNQITAFYGGPLAATKELPLAEITPSLVLISPTHKDVMIAHARACRENSVPYVFDPGQQLGAFSAQELMEMIGNCEYLIANDYEMKLIEQKTGWDTGEIKQQINAVIVTLGEQGSVVIKQENRYEIGICKPESVEDPTGAGDAYRAGFFLALSQKHDIRICGQIGSVAAAYAIEHYGTQNHTFTLDEFKARYQATYGEPCPLGM